MNAQFRSFLTDESGATAIEYSLIAALISIGAASVFPLIGTSLNTLFGKVLTALDAAAGTAGAGTTTGGTTPAP